MVALDYSDEIKMKERSILVVIINKALFCFFGV